MIYLPLCKQNSHINYLLLKTLGPILLENFKKIKRKTCLAVLEIALVFLLEFCFNLFQVRKNDYFLHVALASVCTRRTL